MTSWDEIIEKMANQQLLFGESIEKMANQQLQLMNLIELRGKQLDSLQEEVGIMVTTQADMAQLVNDLNVRISALEGKS